MAEIILAEGVAPPTPGEDKVTLYAKSDSLLYFKNDLGVESQLSGYTDEQAQDSVGAMLTDTNSVDLVYNDTFNTITADVKTRNTATANVSITASGLGVDVIPGAGSYTNEEAQDAVGSILNDSNSIDFNYDDATPAITADVRVRNTATANVSITASGLGVDVIGGAGYTDEQAQDAVGNILSDSNSIDFIYTDATPSITGDVRVRNTATANVSITAAGLGVDVIGGSAYTNEEAQDAVGSILIDSSSIDFTYNDSTPSITASVINDSSTQRVIIDKNSTLVATRDEINFIEGTNVTLTVVDNSGSNRTDVTIAAVGGASGLNQAEVLRRVES